MNKIQQATLTLECLSPIHIGGGNDARLNTTQYLFDTKESKVYFINEQEWISFLSEKKLMDDFEIYVKRANFRSGNQKNLFAWLQEKGIAVAQMRRFISAQAHIPAGLDGSLYEIVRNVSDANDKPYIPGSSIKGAIRTAILFALLRNQSNLRDKYWSEIISSKENITRTLNSVSKKLEMELLHKLRNENNTRSDLLTNSSLRGLQVSDAHLNDTTKDTIIVRKLDIVNKGDTNNTAESPLPIYRECLYPKTKLEFSITIDTAILATLNIKNIQALLTAAQFFTASNIDKLKKAFHQNFHAIEIGYEDANIILGGGAGFIGKSLLYALAPNDDEALRLVRQLMDKSFAKHKHEYNDRIISPRTLKTGIVDNKQYLMGMACIKEK